MYFPNHRRQYKISQMAMVIDDVQEEVIAMIKSIARSRIDEVEKYLSNHTNDDSLWEESFQQKILAEAEIKMADIHVMISVQQKKFMEGRLNILSSSSSSSCYKILRQWEINFIKSHLKPLYEERRQLTPVLSHFWEDAIACQKLIEDQITDMDSEILLFLIDIKSNWLIPDIKGFSLNFIFKDNPYFSNKDLTKTYEVIGDNESVTLKASGTKINWISSCPFTDRKREKSFFFTFFNSYETTEPISFDPKDGELKGNVPTDYRIGKKFRDKIIPLATFRFVDLGIDDSGDDDDDDYDEGCCDCGAYECICNKRDCSGSDSDRDLEY